MDNLKVNVHDKRAFEQSWTHASADFSKEWAKQENMVRCLDLVNSLGSLNPHRMHSSRLLKDHPSLFASLKCESQASGCYIMIDEFSHE